MTFGVIVETKNASSHPGNIINVGELYLNEDSFFQG